MRILSEFDIHFDLPVPTPFVTLLHNHPLLDGQLRFPSDPEALVRAEQVNPGGLTQVDVTIYYDAFGNRCTRFFMPRGELRLSGSSIVEVAEIADEIRTEATQAPIEQLPSDVLQFLLASRYCEVDQLGGIAMDLFGHTTPGWARAIFIRDWVHNHVRFDYKTARPTKTALNVYTERVGVCRDFQHLAIAFSRALNIPARYVTGYLGDVRHPYSGPGDFSAWYEVFLHNRWWTMDARHNEPRYGRILMATGRDATDVAITTSFGVANLTYFYVESNEVDAEGNKLAVPGSPDVVPTYRIV